MLTNHNACYIDAVVDYGGWNFYTRSCEFPVSEADKMDDTGY